jgi:hypothetical protein
MREAIKQLVERLHADRGSPNPRFPTQALAAASGPRVAEPLERCLAAGARLVDVRALPYQATRGPIPVVFARDTGGSIALDRPSAQAVMEGQARVAVVHAPAC